MNISCNSLSNKLFTDSLSASLMNKPTVTVVFGLDNNSTVCFFIYLYLRYNT